MEALVDFLLNNYIWFLVISLIIIFALIGYLVDTTNNNPKDRKKITPITPINNDEKVKVHPSVEKYTNENFDDPLIEDNK